MRFRIRTLLLVAVLVSVVAFGVSSLIGVQNSIRNAYAVWWVGDMVVAHLKANNNEWPRNWDDLADDYDTCVANAGSAPWRFEELKKRVRIDWEADANDLIQRQSGGGPDFKAIWLADGSIANWADAEPNQIVLDYLKRDQKRATKR